MNLRKNPIIKFLEQLLFKSRWLLLFFYFGLMVALVLYAWVFAKETYHIIKEVNSLTKESAMLVILELIDLTMIANLVKMIITGSYNSFVAKDHGYPGENISSGLLKIKMGTSLIGVSSIHLLQTFVNSHAHSWDDIFKQLVIHGAFIIGAVFLSVIEYLHEKGESISTKPNH